MLKLAEINKLAKERRALFIGKAIKEARAKVSCCEGAYSGVSEKLEGAAWKREWHGGILMVLTV